MDIEQNPLIGCGFLKPPTTGQHYWLLTVFIPDVYDSRESYIHEYHYIVVVGYINKPPLPIHTHSFQLPLIN